MGLDEKIATDIAVSTAVNLAQKIRGLVFIPLITKFLGADSYGAFIQVTVVMTLIATVFRFGLDSSLVRYMQEISNRNERARLYYSILVAGIGSGAIAAGVIAMVAEQMSRLTLSTESYKPLFEIGSLLIPLYIIEKVEKNFFRSEMRIKTYSLLDGIKVYLEVGTITVIVWWFDYGLLPVFYGLVGIQILFVGLIQLIITRQIGFRHPSISGFGRYFRYSVPIMITELSGMSQDRADRILLGYFIGPAAVGVYSIAYTLARLLRLFALPLRISFFAEFSRLWVDDRRSDAYQILENGVRYFTALSVPSIVGLYLIGPSLLSELSTDHIGQQALPLLPVLAVGVTCIGSATIYQQIFYAAEQTRIVSVIRATGGIMNIGLNIILIPYLGPLGAAITTLATFGFTALGIGGLARQRFSVPFPLLFIIKATIAAAVMTVVMSIIGFTHYAPILLVAPIVYFTVLYGVGGLSDSDLSFLWTTVRSIRP